MIGNPRKYSVYQFIAVVGLYKRVADNLTWEDAVCKANSIDNAIIKERYFNAETQRYETKPCIGMISENYYKGV